MRGKTFLKKGFPLDPFPKTFKKNKKTQTDVSALRTGSTCPMKSLADACLYPRNLHSSPERKLTTNKKTNKNSGLSPAKNEGRITYEELD